MSSADPPSQSQSASLRGQSSYRAERGTCPASDHRTHPASGGISGRGRAYAAVPTTPGWTITDLVEHVGQTQHWVAEIIERRITDPAQLPTGMAVLPTDPREWQAWLSESAQRVASACSDDALDAPVFNPAGDERSGTRFWMSSVLSETVVHGFDAANAAGRPADIDADIAAALIS